MATELVIYTDESDKEGDYFSNFYGGVLVRSWDLAAVIAQLEACKQQQNLFREIKWQKVTANYLEKYVAMVDAFLDIVAADTIQIEPGPDANQPRGNRTIQIVR